MGKNAKTAKYGFELGFLKDRVFLNMTYARNRSSNQLLQYSLPSIVGVETVIQNVPAKVQNTNWEFSLRTENIKMEHFNWSTSFNLTVPSNKVLAFPGIENTVYANSDWKVIVGQPLGVETVYRFLGVDPASGDYLVADKDGKPTSTPNYRSDRTMFVNTLPKFYGGFQNNVRYKNVEIDIFFRFTKQHARSFDYFNVLVPGQFSQYTPDAGNQLVNVLNRWRNPGDIALFGKYTANPSANSYIKSASDALFVDASFIRLQNISLSWQPPNEWIQRMHLQKCRVFVQAHNFFTITNYEGLDPDVQSAGTMPPLKTLTLGFQIGL